MLPKKRCNKCGEEKALCDFSKKSSTRDGLRNHCKACVKVYSRKRYLRDAKRILEVNDRWMKVRPEYLKKWHEARPGYATELSRKWRAKNPEKYRCHGAVSVGIKDGSIVKPLRCERCGEVKLLDAHHHDYSKPYDIEWLCRGCHHAVHKFIKLITGTNYASK